jgi:hypothetical protein
MKYDISETSRLWLSGDTVTLLVHNSMRKILLGWFSMAVAVLLFIVYYFFERDLVVLIVGTMLFLYGLLSFGYKEFVVIDAKRRLVKRQVKILDFRIQNILISWEKESELKYVISFNSLERISYISLAVYSKMKDTYTFIMNFPEAKAFFAFQKVFNKKFPEFQITETATSKIEFEAAEVHRKQIKSSHNRVLRHKDHLL